MLYDAIGLGELLIDFAPAGADENGYPILAAKAGGGPPNYLAAMSAFGAKTAFLGKVGGDAFGDLLVNTLKDSGVEVKGVIKDPDVFTTLAFVTLDHQGDRSFSFARKPGSDTCLRFEELALTLIDNAKFFHFGTLSLTDEPARTATKKAVGYARSRDCMITFDPNLRMPLWKTAEDAREQILWGLNKADIVKISDEEVDFLWGCSCEEGAGRLLEECGVKLAMITMGPNGCLLKNKNARVTASCPPVKVVDTTGAGDIFGGSAVSQIVKLGKRPEALSADELLKVASFAVAAASLSTQKMGGIPSIPSEKEVLAIL